MKTSRHAGNRTVTLIDSKTVLVTEPGTTGDLYDLQRLQRGRYIVTKIDAEGVPVAGSRPYTVNVEPARCTCDGHKYGYACRHPLFLAALIEAKKLTA